MLSLVRCDIIQSQGKENDLPKQADRKDITMSINEITLKVRELKVLKAMADELTAEITAIEDTIKAEMTAQNVEEMSVDVFKVRYKTITSSRFDAAAFKATHAELYDQYTKQTTSRRFSVA